jgi:hypothetical protein
MIVIIVMDCHARTWYKLYCAVVSNPVVNDVRTYTSTRVFNGTRRLSYTHVKRIQARHRVAPKQPPALIRGLIVVGLTVAAHTAKLAHLVRITGYFTRPL